MRNVFVLLLVFLCACEDEPVIPADTPVELIGAYQAKNQESAKKNDVHKLQISPSGMGFTGTGLGHSISFKSIQSTASDEWSVEPIIKSSSGGSLVGPGTIKKMSDGTLHIKMSSGSIGGMEHVPRGFTQVWLPIKEVPKAIEPPKPTEPVSNDTPDELIGKWVNAEKSSEGQADRKAKEWSLVFGPAGVAGVVGQDRIEVPFETIQKTKENRWKFTVAHDTKPYGNNDWRKIKSGTIMLSSKDTIVITSLGSTTYKNRFNGTFNRPKKAPAE